MVAQSKKYHIIYSFMVAVKKKNIFNSKKQNNYVNSSKNRKEFVHTIKYRDVGESKATFSKFETLHVVKVRTIFHILRAADSNSSGLRSTKKLWTSIHPSPSRNEYAALYQGCNQ
jgi:glycerol-3-phosphate cytidylyltransferase-like family protein